MKQNIAALLCDNRPAIAIVEEYTTCPVLPDAEHVLVGTPPPDFLAAIDDLLLPYGRRHTEHLRRKARLLVNMARELVETAKYIVRQNRQTRAGSRRRRDKRVRADRKNDRKQSG
jgi:hypothetical protein